MCPAKIEKIVHIGDFTVSDGKIAAADPCQKSLDELSSVLIASCAVGLWHAFVEDDTANAYKLIAIHSKADPGLASWTISLGNTITVLSGQAGLFDQSRYQYDRAFYEKLCDLTARAVADAAEHKLPGLEAWCFEWGAVSATASGDGKFLCYTMVDQGGTTVGVAIDFYKSYTAWTDISLCKILPGS